ncbi:MAG TPA: prolyl oligopeptidase family serine peptidase [Verrucomicrobiae bacterium]|nr:prolyl oligopeptidase family serine peptidase [Verrucomicrobiae bacterium]
MNRIGHFLVAIISLAFIPANGWTQSLPNLALARLNYTVTKRTVNPQGGMKEKTDAVDKDLAEATRLGNNSEVRRLLAKGMTLLAGKEWTDVLDFRSSLVLRSDRVFVDSSKPYVVRLEQLYSPSLQLDHALAAHVSLGKPRTPASFAEISAPPQPGEVVKDLGKFDEVSRDLRESPLVMELDLAGVADGSYQVQAEVLDGDRLLGLATLRIVVRKGLDDTLAHLSSEAARVPESLRADVLYAVEHIRNIDLGRAELGQFDLAKELTAASDVLVAAQAGKDPFAGRTGDIKRHYLLQAANEIMPYRVYVPTTYTPGHAFPLVVALHGLGATEDSMLTGFYNVPRLAEQHGYIVVAPLGYRTDAAYGAFRVAGKVTRRGQLSEQDVMEVLQRIRQQYKIDENRIYLMGHSMGGYGTWAIGASHPELWAALGPISGAGDPATVEKMRAIPEVVVHGDADNVVPVAGSRTMVAEMKKLGVEVKYIEVPGGSHISVAGQNMSAIFDFFDAHKKGPVATSSAH